jgi:ADP-heptose:LPS heptosyltransferase
MSTRIPRGYGKGFHYSRTKVWIARLLELLFLPLVARVRRLEDLDCARRILIMEPFQLGDNALLAVMLQPLRDRFPAAEIHILTRSPWTCLFQHDPRVAKVHAFTFPWVRRAGRGWSLAALVDTWRFTRLLRKERFDIGLDVRGDIRSQIVLLLAGCP